MNFEKRNNRMRHEDFFGPEADVLNDFFAHIFGNKDPLNYAGKDDVDASSKAGVQPASYRIAQAVNAMFATQVEEMQSELVYLGSALKNAKKAQLVAEETANLEANWHSEANAENDKLEQLLAAERNAFKSQSEQIAKLQAELYETNEAINTAPNIKKLRAVLAEMDKTEKEAEKK